jgi:branched-chain amino acid transport system ATP-binding protein
VSEEILATSKLSRSFGGVRAVRDVSLGVPRGQLRAIIGPNGAGKTTLFNLLTGEVRCDGGQIFFKGAEITGRPPHYLCRKGLARTFQINSIFPSATVFENVQLAILAHRGKTWNPLASARGLVVGETEEILERLGLADEADKTGGTLSYGDRRRLEVALALACKPEVLLLDEPTSGMSLSEKPALVQLIRSVVKEKGVTTVLIEHDMDVVFSVSDWITVMHQGTVLAEGTPGEIQANTKVQEVYLGDERHA